MSFEMDKEPRSIGNRIIDVIFWVLSIVLVIVFIYVGARDISQRFPSLRDDE